MYSAKSIKLKPLDASAQIYELITFGFRLYQETSGFFITDITVL